MEELLQADADALIALTKIAMDEQAWQFPNLGGRVSIPLQSQDGREFFCLDCHRGRIDLSKLTHQNRTREVVILVRLDLGGRPHRNPDDQEVPSPHLHLYREGFGDRWAFPVPPDRFTNLGNVQQTLADFMDYCNVAVRPQIQWGLF